MLINNYSKLNFNAKPLNIPNVKNTVRQRISQGNYIPTKTKFVEIDPDNKQDIKTLLNITNYWIYAKYASTIAYSTILKKENKDIFKNIRIFALTKQDKDYENLDDKEILGIVEVEKSLKDVVLINYLQVNPEYIYNFDNPQFTHCGSQILNYLKSMFKNNTIRLSSANANTFYEKNGFVLVNGSENKYMWNKDLEQ